VSLSVSNFKCFIQFVFKTVNIVVHAIEHAMPYTSVLVVRKQSERRTIWWWAGDMRPECTRFVTQYGEQQVLDLQQINILITKVEPQVDW